MTVKEIKKTIKQIKELASDPESAHTVEDDLYFSVLEEISKNPSNAQVLAKKALKTKKVDFPRWCA